MSFGLLVAGFLATANAGRVALAGATIRAVAAGAALVVAGTLLADPLLDALSISPESFRIAAALVLAVTGAKTLVAPAPSPGPLVAVLITPELLAFSITAGAGEDMLEVLAAAAIGLLPAALGRGGAASARFLAALQLVVAVALAVLGVREV